MKKIFTLAAVAITLAFASSKALAVGDPFPWVPLNISATLKYTTGTKFDDTITTKGAPLTEVTINNKTILSMISIVTSSNIPAGSQILWNPDYEDLLITNKNGFYMYPSDCYIEPGEYNMTGTFTKNSSTGAGSENDLTGVYIELWFNNQNYIEAYGLATFNWTYGAQSAGNQKATLSASMSFQGSDDCYINDDEAEIISGTASGSGSAIDPTDDNPFVFWW